MKAATHSKHSITPSDAPRASHRFIVSRPPRITPRTSPRTCTHGRPSLASDRSRSVYWRLAWYETGVFCAFPAHLGYIWAVRHPFSFARQKDLCTVDNGVSDPSSPRRKRPNSDSA
eukprot:3137669-Prymnesium_polylepis.2